MKFFWKRIHVDLLETLVIDSTKNVEPAGHLFVMEHDIFLSERATAHFKEFMSSLFVEMIGITKKFSEYVTHSLRS